MHIYVYMYEKQRIINHNNNTFYQYIIAFVTKVEVNIRKYTQVNIHICIHE